MKPTHKLAAGVAAVAFLAGGAFTLPRAFAADSTSTDPVSSLIDKIATKFNLNRNDVQAVFDENRAAQQASRQAQMKTELDNRLTQAVTDGNITQAQKDMITAKMTEVQAKVTEIMKTTDANSRQAQLDQLQADVSKWAADNKIDTKWIRILGGRGGHGMGRGHGDRDGMMGMPTSSTTSSTSATSTPATN